ncbi:Pyrin [Liparis tanakae]|uniref:Pyrin n=1 Tax=Liparis tanakae TaxID=230148 RepID=A0A4Z2FHH5_9TELE|nr:Pyrin [Liparis tanakae]
MSFQICHCGWSKITTYQGLRIHQGKKGCTPKGMGIPESEQFRFSGHLPQLSYQGPHIHAENDFMNMFPPAVQLNTWGSNWDSSHGMNSDLFNGTTSIKTENLPVTPNLTTAEDSVIAALEALKPPMRTQDPYRPPREFDFASGAQTFTTRTDPTAVEVTVEQTNTSEFQTPPLHAVAPQTTAAPRTTAITSRALDFASGAQSPPLQTFTTGVDPAAAEVTVDQTPPLHAAAPQTTAASQTTLNAHRVLGFTSGAQPSLWPPFQTFTTRADPAAGEVTMEQTPPLHSAAFQSILNAQRALNFTTCAQPSLWPPLQNFTTRADPAAVEVKMEQTNTLAFQTPPLHTTAPQTPANTKRALDFASVAQPSLWPPLQIFTTRAGLAATAVTVEQTPPLHAAAPQTTVSPQTPANAHRALHFTSGAQSSLLQTVTTGPAAAEVTVEQTNTSAFQTPPLLHTTAPKTTGNARRALDFTTCAQQVEQQLGHLPTTTAQDTVNQKEREKEREPQKLQRVKQDRMTAELQLNIQAKEQKMSDVKTSVQVCKGDLDTEWLEINGVFSKLMKVVEDARQKALRPVEERRKRLKREAQDTVRKMQKKIDQLKMTLDDLQTHPDLKFSPQSCDCQNVAVDSSFSFGTLRTTTSIMMKEIQQELEKLSSIELKRIPSFAVDVELDPTTAHPNLVLSPDGKSVRDGGKNQKVPDGPQRFDEFSSILGLGRLTSGKSYWEVEVSNKAGWDLGVARCNAKRKGALPLNPDSGYWVTVHYEDKKYAALAAPPVSLPLAKKPQKVGVFVDYEEGLVSFYDVGAKAHIYSFTECSFGGGRFGIGFYGTEIGYLVQTHKPKSFHCDPAGVNGGSQDAAE